MKLKEIAYLLGLKPPARSYGHELRTQFVPGLGQVEVAQWRRRRRGLKISPEEIDDLRRFILPGDFAVDIGAHWGDSTLPIALACGAEGCVAAFEPNPFTFTTLAANALLNPGLARIVPVPVAAVEEDGPVTFSYDTPHYNNGGNLSARRSRWRHAAAFDLEVEGRRLEPFLEKHFGSWLARFRYMKVDAEGHDLAVLKTIDRLIDSHRPHIKAEVYRHLDGRDRAEMFAFFQSRGYEVRRVLRETLFGPVVQDAAAMADKASFDVFAIPQQR
jgi:FkbM family methyltransferase